MLTQDIAEIKDGRIITKDGRTVDQIYKGFQLYKSGKAPAEFTAIKEKDQYQGSLDDVKRQIDKYWDKKDAEEVMKGKTIDDESIKGKDGYILRVYKSGSGYNWEVYDPEGQKTKTGLSAGSVQHAKESADQKLGMRIFADSKPTIDALDPDETHDVRDIEKETIANNYFRKVLFTSERLRLVLMSLKPGEEIGEEVHPTTDQFFRIEEGKAKAIVDGKEIILKDGSSILIKSGRVHNIINDSDNPLKLYSLYSPPQHQDGLIQKEKET